MVATPTGANGGAEDLEPESDTALIGRAVQAAAEAMPVREMLRQASMPVET